MKEKNNSHEPSQSRNYVYQNIKISEQQIKERKIKDALTSLKEIRQKYNLY